MSKRNNPEYLVSLDVGTSKVAAIVTPTMLSAMNTK